MALTALSAASPAAFGMDPALRGFYIGGSVGEASVKLEDNDSFVDFEGDDTDELVYMLSLGVTYQF